jgi:hypothetical protein
MTVVGGEVPGPLTRWRPEVGTDNNRVKFEEFPDSLYPAPHLETIKNSSEKWGNRRNGYPHIEKVYLLSTENHGASGNCYFMASITLHLVFN